MTSSMSIKEEEEEEEEQSKKPASVKQVNYDVWDLVPGQPNLSGGVGLGGSSNGNSGSAVCDSSSGISSSSSTTNKSKQDHQVQTGTTSTNWLDQVSELISKSDSSDNSKVPVIPASSEPSSGLLDDPFDADWAALATRSFDTQKKNPFHQGGSSDAAADIQIQKAFELQM